MAEQVEPTRWPRFQAGSADAGHPRRGGLFRQAGGERLKAPTRDHSLYRAVLGRWWRLVAQRAQADRVEVTAAYQELLRLLDELGEPQGTRLRRRWARAWYQKNGELLEEERAIPVGTGRGLTP